MKDNWITLPWYRFWFFLSSYQAVITWKTPPLSMMMHSSVHSGFPDLLFGLVSFAKLVSVLPLHVCSIYLSYHSQSEFKRQSANCWSCVSLFCHADLIFFSFPLAELVITFPACSNWFYSKQMYLFHVRLDTVVTLHLASSNQKGIYSSVLKIYLKIILAT